MEAVSGGRGRGAALVGAVICAWAAVLAAPARPQQSQTASEPKPSPCASAEALVKAGEPKEARKEYIKVLNANPSSDCATEGLTKLNKPKPEASCAAADTAFKNGDLDLARTKYKEAGGKCGEAGVAAVAEVELLCAQAARYEELDRDDDAVTTYKKVLEKSPNAGCVNEEVFDEAWVTSATDWVSDNWWRVLLALGLAGLILVPLARAPAINRRLMRLPLVGRLFSPRLAFDPIDSDSVDPKAGTALQGRIAERLQAYNAAARATELSADELDQATPREEFADLVAADRGIRSAFTKVTESSDQAKFAGALFEFVLALLPRRKLGITAVLEPPATRVGASFSLDGDGRVLASTTLAGRELDQAAVSADYLELAEPAAVWIQYETARAVNGGEVGPDEAESHAFLRKGLAYQLAAERASADASTRDENLREARRAYEEARRLNPRNWAARVNLAVLEARLARDFRGSIRTLRYAIEDMRELEGG
jgi:tetratricopeptide (TPR) repeat protein